MRKIANTTKRWMFISMLFLGISLTVYAAATRVTISNLLVDNITSTTADITVAYSGATRLNFYASFTPYGTYPLIISIDATSEGFNYETISLGGLTPNTTYYIIVEAVSVPDPNDPDNVNYAYSDIISFVTALEDLE